MFGCGKGRHSANVVAALPQDNLAALVRAPEQFVSRTFLLHGHTAASLSELLAWLQMMVILLLIEIIGTYLAHGKLFGLFL